MLKSYVTAYIEEITSFARGGLCCGDGRQVFKGLHGLTLTFTNPAGAVTFSDPQGAGLKISDINTQIQAVLALATVRARLVASNLWFVQDTPTAPIALAAPQEAARVILGLPASGAISGTILAPKGTRPANHIVDLLFQNERFILVYDDAYNPAGLGAATSSQTLALPSAGNTVLTTPSSYIYVGVAGDVYLHLVGNAPAVSTPYKGVKAGDTLFVAADTIYSTTTATDLVIHF